MGNRALYSYNYTIPEPADGVYTKYEQACVSSGKIKEHQSKTVEECELLCDVKSNSRLSSLLPVCAKLRSPSESKYSGLPINFALFYIFSILLGEKPATPALRIRGVD